MTLRQKQSKFVIKIAQLIMYADGLGYELTFGQAERSIQEAIRLKKKNSVHTIRLAIDLNLFRNGNYLSSTESHKPLGEWWEEQSEEGLECCWGGRFGDGNHYSIKHNGVK